MTELRLWDEPIARHTDPDTSHQAARDARTLSGPHRMAGWNGLTDFELAAITGVQQTSIGVRRKELVRAGYVEDSGRRRPAPSGSAAIVWRAKP